MNQQEEETVKFFHEHMEQERRQAEGTASSTAAVSSSPMETTTATPIDENHITRRPAQVHCNLGFKDLVVLKELRVDFNNITSNGFDLREELIFQGWENYFARLHGPVYENLVKEFWRQADWDKYHVVSYVLGKKIIITEKTIAHLLGLTHLASKRINMRITRVHLSERPSTRNSSQISLQRRRTTRSKPCIRNSESGTG